MITIIFTILLWIGWLMFIDPEFCCEILESMGIEINWDE